MSSAPRWLETLKSALMHPDNKDKIVYQLATVDPDGHPRVRSHVHRGFMEPEGHPELPILISTTDARTPKVTQARSNQRVELAWWMEGTQEQFRISGFVYVLPAPAQGSGPTPIPAGAAALTLLKKSGFDFEAKRKEAFDKMSTAMRATWWTPYTPGTVLPSYDEQKAWPSEIPLEQDAKTDRERKDIEVASRNFALMLIEPVQVDWVSLAVQPMTRVSFTREGEKWVEQQLVP